MSCLLYKIIKFIYSAFGLYTPMFIVPAVVLEPEVNKKVIILQTHLGLSWILGCVFFGLLIGIFKTKNHRDINRLYLCQTAMFICALSISGIALVNEKNSFLEYSLIWTLGFFCGGYHYALKMLTFQKVRSRNFNRAWGYIQFSQSIPVFLGTIFSAYLTTQKNKFAGFFFSSLCIMVGSFSMLIIKVKKQKRSVKLCHFERNELLEKSCKPEIRSRKTSLSNNAEPQLVMNTTPIANEINDDQLSLEEGRRIL